MHVTPADLRARRSAVAESARTRIPPGLATLPSAYVGTVAGGTSSSPRRAGLRVAARPYPAFPVNREGFSHDVRPEHGHERAGREPERVGAGLRASSRTRTGHAPVGLLLRPPA